MPDSATSSVLSEGSPLLTVPQIVQAAIRLLWLHVALIPLWLAVFYLTLVQSWPGDLVIVMQIASFAVTVGFTLLLMRGFGWVRYVWVTLVLASGVQTVKGLGTWFDRSWLAGITNLVGTSALWIALALLFFPEARGWFRRAQLARRGR
jgi:hypothetical protein